MFSVAAACCPRALSSRRAEHRKHFASNASRSKQKRSSCRSFSRWLTSIAAQQTDCRATNLSETWYKIGLLADCLLAGLPALQRSKRVAEPQTFLEHGHPTFNTFSSLTGRIVDTDQESRLAIKTHRWLQQTASVFEQQCEVDCRIAT